MQHSTDTIKNIYFLLFPGVHLLDFTGPAHVFYEAIEYGAPLRLHYLHTSKETEVLPSSAGLTFTALKHFRDVRIQKGDYVFVAGADFNIIGSKQFKKAQLDTLKWLYELDQEGHTIASVCTGAFVLAQANILDGRACTTHWKYTEKLQTHFPKTKVEQRRLFIKSNNVYTSAGVSSGIDLSLHILEQELGYEFAQKVAREVVVYLRRNPEDPQLSPFLQYRNHMDDRVQQVQDWIADHLDHKMTVSSLASLVFVTPRHLSRIFKTATSITVQEYIRQLRIAKAKELLETGYKLDYVARACGYSNGTVLKRLL